MKSIALGLGGTNMKAAIVENEQMFNTSSIPFSSKTDFSITMQKIASHINLLMNGLQGGINEINGIGLSMNISVCR